MKIILTILIIIGIVLTFLFGWGLGGIHYKRDYQIDATQNRIYIYDGDKLLDSITPGKDSLTAIIDRDNL